MGNLQKILTGIVLTMAGASILFAVYVIVISVNHTADVKSNNNTATAKQFVEENETATTSVPLNLSEPSSVNKSSDSNNNNKLSGPVKDESTNKTDTEELDTSVNSSTEKGDDLPNNNSASKYDEIADGIAKQMVQKFLKDPDSAIFKEITEIAHDNYLRYIFKVTVNAKNGFGGYVGYESYWVYFRIISSDDINGTRYFSLYNLELMGGPPKWDSVTMANVESYRPDEWNKKPESDSDY